MSSVTATSTTWTPLSETEREEVREQMERLLQTSHFRNSRRYPALFRFIVEETLEGRGDFLKERLLGVSVFHRPAGYDTASDPIVRVTIAEIRKRIAQYYHEEAHEAEMRIELMPGRYAPEFRKRREGPVSTLVDQAAPQSAYTLQPASSSPEQALLTDNGMEVPALEVAAAQSRHMHLDRLLRQWPGLVAAALLGALVILGAPPLYSWVFPPALDQLWAPVLSASRPVLIVIPAGAGKSLTDAGLQPMGSTANAARPLNPTFLDHEALGENVVFSDVLAALRVGGLLALHQRDYRVRLSPATTLNDLREGPGVLIGGMDNIWTMRASAGLPFHFAGSDEQGYWIADTRNPGNRAWLLNLKMQYAAVNRDYAIVARVHNEQTGQPEILLAGIGMSGTAAAGEFLVDPRQTEDLRRRIGPGFKDHDFEAVLSTDVVNGSAGSPKILAVAVW